MVGFLKQEVCHLLLNRQIQAFVGYYLNSLEFHKVRIHSSAIFFSFVVCI